MRPAARERPVRIVQLLTTLDPAGVERSVLELARHLDPARFRSEAWYLRGRGARAARFRESGLPVRHLPLLFQADLSIVPRLAFALRRVRADILHTHHPEATAFGRLAAPHSGVRAVITTEHTVVHWSEPGRFVNRLVRATASRADRVVSVSRAVEYLACGAGAAPRDRSSVIHDGIPAVPGSGVSGRAAARERFSLPADGPIVASLGRLLPQKGLSQMIETMPLILSERADAWFAIAGAGPEREKLERQAQTLEVRDRLIMVGEVDDPHQFLPAVDVFLLPSLTEGYGIAGLEAMAHGIPIVGTHAGGIPELLGNANGGLIVNANAPREIAAVALYLLNSPLYSAEIGGAGRQRLAGTGPGTAAHMAAAYTALYEEVL